MSGHKKSPPPATDIGGLYITGDRIPTPHAVEADTDSAWALFNELRNKQEAHYADTEPVSPTAPGALAKRGAEPDTRFADTEPAGLQHRAAAPAAARVSTRTATPTVASVMQEARRNNRVCPRPLQWQALCAQLATLRGDSQPGRAAAGLLASATAWHATPPLSKRVLLRQQVEWAAAQGVLEPVQRFLASLQEDEWQHMED